MRSVNKLFPSSLKTRVQIIRTHMGGRQDLQSKLTSKTNPIGELWVQVRVQALIHKVENN